MTTVNTPENERIYHMWSRIAFLCSLMPTKNISAKGEENLINAYRTYCFDSMFSTEAFSDLEFWIRP
jgi:hypothetical protein